MTAKEGFSIPACIHRYALGIPATPIVKHLMPAHPFHLPSWGLDRFCLLSGRLLQWHGRWVVSHRLGSSAETTAASHDPCPPIHGTHKSFVCISIKNALIVSLFLFFAATVSLPAADPSLWERLTPQQQTALSSGKQVVLEEEIPDTPWPRLTIYQLVKSSSADVAAVFWNSELDTKYLPNCKSARILGRPSRDVHEAEFVLGMPLFLPDELYVSRISIRSPSENVYEISWKVLESRYSKECNGTIRIEPHGDQALFSYRNLVKPRSNFAGLLRWPAQATIVDSVKSLVREVETERQKNPRLLATQLQAVELALGKR